MQDAWRELGEFLRSQPDVEIVAAEITEDVKLHAVEADLVVVLGGDGAILRACRKLAYRQLPIVGVNLGRLGFLADLAPEEFRELFDEFRHRHYSIAEHLMFECALKRPDGNRERFLGLNDVVVSAGGSLRMIDIELSINGDRVATYSGDGLIVATPVGSTAHSLSAGGPLLHQELSAFVITPICPHTLTNRPLVDHAGRTYTLRLPSVPEGVLVVIDGQVRRPLQSGDEIEIRQAPVTFKLARIAGHSYYAALHRKLGWAGQPRYRKR